MGRGEGLEQAQPAVTGGVPIGLEFAQMYVLVPGVKFPSMLEFPAHTRPR